jgi:hypothetical protein
VRRCRPSRRLCHSGRGCHIFGSTTAEQRAHHRIILNIRTNGMRSLDGDGECGPVISSRGQACPCRGGRVAGVASRRVTARGERPSHVGPILLISEPGRGLGRSPKVFFGVGRSPGRGTVRSGFPRGEALNSQAKSRRKPAAADRLLDRLLDRVLRSVRAAHPPWGRAGERLWVVDVKDAVMWVGG